MPSPYLSRIKLEKELEKRAQEIKQKRERSEKLIKDIESGLNILKKYVDVGTYLNDFKKAKDAFSIKDFDKALGILEPMFTKLSREATKVFEENEKKIAKLLSSGKIEDSAKIKANMDEAKSKLSTNFVESLNIMENISLQISSSLKDLAERRRREILAKITGLENFEDIKEEIEKISGSSLEILDSLEKIEKKIRDRVKKIMDEKITEADKLIAIAKSAHYTLPVDEGKKNDAENALKNGDFSAAIKASNEYLKDTKSAFKLFFTKIMDISKILIGEGEAMGEDMSSPKSLLEMAGEAYEKEELEEAVNLVRKATEEAEKIKLRKVMDLIKIARDKLLEAKNNGIDIGPYLSMIENARNFIKIGKHKRAYDTVQNAINMVERRVNLYSQLKSEIKELEDTIEGLKRENIILEGVEDKLAEIEKKVDEKPEDAERMIDDLKNLIKVNIREIATSLTQEINSRISKAQETGIDLEDLKIEVDNTYKLIEEENYKDAIITLRKIEERLYTNILDSVKSRISDFEKYEELKRDLEDLKNYVDSGDIDSSLEKVKAMESEVFKIEAKKYEDMLMDLESKCDFLRSLGEDVSKIEEYINSARNALNSKDLGKVEEHVKEARALIETFSKSIAQRAYESAKDSMDDAIRAGIDVKKNGIEDMLTEAEKCLKNGDYQGVLEHTSKLKNVVQELIGKIKRLDERRGALESRMEELRDLGLEVDELEKLLKDIEREIKESNFDSAEELINQGFERATLIQLEGKIEALKDEIEALGRIMRDFNLRKEYLSITGEFFLKYRNKEYEALEEVGKETLEKLRKSVERVFENYVSQIESMVQDLQDMGATINTKPIREGKELFWGGDIIGAFSILKKFEEDVKRIHGDKMKLQEIEDRLSSLLAIMSSLGLNSDKFAGRIKEVEEIEDNSEKISKLEELLKELEDAIREKINAILSTVENELDKMRRMGEDVTAAEGMISRARSQMNQGNYKTALYLMFEALEEVENVGMQKNTAYEMLRTTEMKIKSMGRLLPPDIIKEYKNARILFLNERYREAIHRILEISEKLWSIERTIYIIKDRNAKIKVYIQQAKKKGIDMKDVLLSLARAKSELQKLNYEAALRFVNDAYKRARRSIESTKEQYRVKYEPLLKMLIEFDLRDKFEDLVKAIDEAFEKDDISRAESLINQLKVEIDNALKERMRTLMDEFEERRAFVENSPLRNKINLAEDRKKLEELMENPRDFFKTFPKVMERVNSIIPEILKNYIDEFVENVKNFEKAGVSVSDYIEKAKDLADKTGESDYKEIMEDLQALKNNFEVYIEEYSKEKMQRSLSMVAKYSEKKAEEFKKRMEELYEKKDYLNLIKLTDEAISYVGNYRNLVSRFNTKALSLKDLIKRAISLGLNMDNQIKKLKVILSSPEDLEKAIEKMDVIANEIKEEIDKLKPEIKITIMNANKTDDRYMVKLEIKNTGNVDAKNISITMNGALNTDKPIGVVKLAKSGTEYVDTLLTPGEGDAVHINLKYQRFDNREYEEELTIKFKVSKKGFHIEKNKEKVKCTLCRGTILPGLDIVVCDNCGAVYHLPCAKRVGKCLKCGTPFNFE